MSRLAMYPVAPVTRMSMAVISFQFSVISVQQGLTTDD
jgi:hypothetical protein